MSAKWQIAVFLIATILFSTSINIVTGREQKSVRLVKIVKIPETDILPAKSLQYVEASDSGWVFGYDQYKYQKKMAVEDIPTATPFQERAPLVRSVLQYIDVIESGYAIGYDGDGNLVKLPISEIPDDDWSAFTNVFWVVAGCGYAFAAKPGIFAGGGFIKVSIDDIPFASRSLDIVCGADRGYVIGFEVREEEYVLRKLPMNTVREVPIERLSTVKAVDSGYVIGLDSQGRLVEIPLSKLETGDASSLANGIIVGADSGYVVCEVFA